jgi:hypothetical protein
MMRTGSETPEQERARQDEARRFSKRVREILGAAPDIVFEHVGKATFPTSVFVVKPFGKVVICAGTTGYNLDFDVRYLWMRQKEIIGSHFANAYECQRANELIEQHLIRPVLWRTFGFDGVGEAHQLMKDNRHLGKIAILVGASREGRRQDRGGTGSDPRGGGYLMSGVGSHSLVRDGLPRRPAAGRADPRLGARNALRRDRLRGPPQPRRPLQAPADARVRRARRLRSLLVRPRDDRLPHLLPGLVPGADHCTAGPTS